MFIDVQFQEEKTVFWVVSLHAQYFLHTLFLLECCLFSISVIFCWVEILSYSQRKNIWQGQASPTLLVSFLQDVLLLHSIHPHLQVTRAVLDFIHEQMLRVQLVYQQLYGLEHFSAIMKIISLFAIFLARYWLTPIKYSIFSLIFAWFIRLKNIPYPLSFSQAHWLVLHSHLFSRLTHIRDFLSARYVMKVARFPL